MPKVRRRAPRSGVHEPAISELGYRGRFADWRSTSSALSAPAVSNERQSIDDRGHVVYRLEHSFHDGTTHVVLDPMEFPRHIRVPHPFGAAFGCPNWQSCRSGSPPSCHSRFAGDSKSHLLDREMSALGPVTHLTTTTPILPQQRRSAGCLTYTLPRLSVQRDRDHCHSGKRSSLQRRSSGSERVLMHSTATVQSVPRRHWCYGSADSSMFQESVMERVGAAVSGCVGNPNDALPCGK